MEGEVFLPRRKEEQIGGFGPFLPSSSLEKRILETAGFSLSNQPAVGFCKSTSDTL